jgi:drug/metabolite transporter (DMT)-like permease
VHERIVWWRPSDRGWWIGALFAVGSTCFALGSFPPYASLVGATADDVTFFVGSLFFTSAALLQFRASPTRIDWWAGLVQFVGTLFFNRSTFQALQQNVSAAEVDRHVWLPDALGSIAFLVASAIACVAVRRHAAHAPRTPDWWAAWWNMAGSIAFGVSDVGAFVILDSDVLRNARWANLGTFAGAVCFLVGAVLILPREPASVPAD